MGLPMTGLPWPEILREFLHAVNPMYLPRTTTDMAKYLEQWREESPLVNAILESQRTT